MRCLLYSSQAARTPLRVSKIYALLVFVPLGIAAHTSGWPSITILIFNLLAIIPLSALVSYAADKLSNTWGELIGGLINATFGNAVELVVCPPSIRGCFPIRLIMTHRLAFWP
jgi:Ca2+:H+ antiporter